MTDTKTNPIFRLMPSLADVAFLLPLIFVFGGMNGVSTMLGDGDTGWHVRTGQWILAHHQVPRQDMFSFTRPGQPWFAWEWLWDVSFAWLFQHWGMASVVLASLLVISLTSALLYQLVHRRCGNPLVAIALTGLAAAGSSIHWLARPHLFTMLFMVIFLTILERVHEGRKRLLWSLPLLTILWTNLHGGFLVGIVLVGAYAGGELLRAIVNQATDAGQRAERSASLRASAGYLLCAAGCAAATLVNPYGYHLHEHIYQYLRDPFLTKYILEFQSANFQNGAAIYLEVMLLLGIAAAVWYGRRKQFTEGLMILGWAHLALVSQRNIPIYMIAAAPIVARPLVEWLRALSKAPIAAWLRSVPENLEEIGMELEPMERPWRVHAVSAAVIVLLALGMGSPGAGKKLKAEYDPARYPAKALAVLNRPGERIFTHDEWGDYLIYKLSPQGTRVFVDGRSDFYGSKFDQDDYLDVMNVKYTWQKTLDRYGVDTILLPPDAPLAGALKESPRWRVTYDDGIAIVFRPAEEAASRWEQVSTRNKGGIGGRDLVIARTSNVSPEDHVNHYR
jgi:hypothetical protein